MKVIIQQNENALKALRLISNLTIKNILDYLISKGPTSPSKIAKDLNMSPSTVSRCLNELRKYNVVKAKWKTISIEERPIKIYRIVPNILRFDLVLNKPEVKSKGKKIIFRGSLVSDFKEKDRKGVYVSLDTIPFRFEGIASEIIKELSKNEYTVDELKRKFKDRNKEFKIAMDTLATFGLIELKESEAE